MGLAETILTVPLTRGSRTKFFPVISLTAFTTPSMSALTKLSVTRSGPLGRAAERAASVGAVPADQAWPAQANATMHTNPVRNQRCFIDDPRERHGYAMAISF